MIVPACELPDLNIHEGPNCCGGKKFGFFLADDSWNPLELSSLNPISVAYMGENGVNPSESGVITIYHFKDRGVSDEIFFLPPELLLHMSLHVTKVCHLMMQKG